MLDVNKDKKVCETDLFNSLKMLNSSKLLDLMMTDILTCMQMIDQIRVKEGKDDPEKIKLNILRSKIQEAIE